MNSQCNRGGNGDEIKRILEKIVAMQREAVKVEVGQEMCDSFLGNNDLCRFRCNTRPLQVFTDDDAPWHTPVHRESSNCHMDDDDKSCILRVEKVEDGTATFRALKDCGFDEDNRRRFESTDSFIIIKLGCICALRCLKDTFVDICIR